jgi:protein-tyrosine phosphatase
MAEGILRKKVEDRNLQIQIGSAGTGDWHAGEHPDPRAIATAKKFQINISNQVARQFTVNDFDNFDRIFAMDQSNLENILSIARNENDKSKVGLLLDFLPHLKNKNVPDPWFGGDEGFIDVFHLLEEAMDSYLKKV